MNEIKTKADEIAEKLLREGSIWSDPNTGKVYGSRWESRKERGCVNKFGYVVFTAHCGGARAQLKAHRVVWISVNGPIPRGMVIDHINRIKTDNRIENLRLVSVRENNINRRSYSGEQNPATKINKEIAADIRWHYGFSNSYSLTAVKFGVSRSLIAQIVRGELWR